MSSGGAEMEGVEPATPTKKDDGGGMEARFDNLCKSVLALDEGITKEAVSLFRKFRPVLLANMSTFGSGSPEEIERHWSVFALLCVTKLWDGKAKAHTEKGGLSLSRILKAAKMNIVDFFREMPQLLLKSGHILSGLYGPDWERRLQMKEAQANFVHLRLLSNYYRCAYEKFFLPSDTSSGKGIIGISSTGFISEYHRFGWLLFLALRIHAFSRLKDLVSCTNGLVSILVVLILHVPVCLRKFSFLDSTFLVKKTDKGVDLLAYLCDIYHTSEDDLRKAMDKVNGLIVDILKKRPCPASECRTENLFNLDTDGLTYFKDLMEPDSLQSSLHILERDYDDTVLSKGELDERIFVNDDNSLLGSGSISGGGIGSGSVSGGGNSTCGLKRKFDSISSPCKSIKSALSPPRSPASPAIRKVPGRATVPPTPVSTAMTTAKWLRTIISPLPSIPSVELERFLSSCDKDVTTEVTYRAKIILEAIFPSSSSMDTSVAGALHNASLMDNTWAAERKMEALKLYYRVLEAMCRAESRILHGNNLTSLLSNERFHRCMLACSAELVLATHKTVAMMFPAVLERTCITAFDFSKVIESFVRHEESLPGELKRHLNSLEERLLESMAWEKGSSMYNSLIVARPVLSVEINRLGLLAEPMPSLDSIAMHHNTSNGGVPPLSSTEVPPDLNGDVRSPTRVSAKFKGVLLERSSFSSPVKDGLLAFYSPKSKLPHIQPAFATPTRPNPAGGGGTCAEAGIKVFFDKITKLAALRIRTMCEKLQLSEHILKRAYGLIKEILNQRTSLFFNRHIDQLILCSLYGVAKISQLPLTFKEIINCYRKQPHCKPQVFRSVFVDWPSNGQNGKTGQEHIDIISFYNRVFIPTVKPLLVDLGSAESTLTNNGVSDVDGQCSASPRSSQFPNLPDISPKKVSAAHNVYVSPLRSSKKGILLSPSSKSCYACIGESTHAYQSPSKDLNDINKRLNSSGRKIRLNFDMVSDSLVAGSLGSQNGTSSFSATTAVKPVKCEKPDA